MCTCKVHDGGLEESTVPPKFKTMGTIPDGGLEEKDSMCNRPYTVAGAVLWASTVQKNVADCVHVKYALPYAVFWASKVPRK